MILSVKEKGLLEWEGIDVITKASYNTANVDTLRGLLVWMKRRWLSVFGSMLGYAI